MKVLILGASGFIGLPVAQALVRAGHIVYGLVRSEEKAKKLRAEEIIPILGDVADTNSWTPTIAIVDAVIDALGGTLDLKNLGASVLEAVQKNAVSLRPSHAPKLTFIYTSGAWVHGDDRKTIVSDTTPLTNPCTLVSWRVAHEQEVVNSQNTNGIVIRPSLLYGKGMSIFSLYFSQAVKSGVVRWPGTPGGNLALIHGDDLSDLYVRVVENGLRVKGVIFDASNDVMESTDVFLEKLASISGAASWEFTKPSNLFEEALSSTAILRPYLGRALLGWRPQKPGLIDNLEVYYDAWKATQ